MKRGVPGSVAVASLAFLLAFGIAQETPRKDATPAAFEARGRLVCIPEAMKELYRADVAPVHEHILGLQVEADLSRASGAPLAASRSAALSGPAGEPVGLYTLLRTPLSEALFADDRFRAKMLVLSGRRFPGTTVCEVSRFRWIRDGKLYDVHYWCEVCSIRGVNPGPCACCQGKVELREALVSEK